jgi:hypothetical protein
VCNAGHGRKKRRQNRGSDVRAEDETRPRPPPSFYSPTSNENQTPERNTERTTVNGDNENDSEQKEIFKTKQETVLDDDLTQEAVEAVPEEPPSEILEPQPSTSSETSANHLNYTGKVITMNYIFNRIMLKGDKST